MSRLTAYTVAHLEQATSKFYHEHHDQAFVRKLGNRIMGIDDSNSDSPVMRWQIGAWSGCKADWQELKGYTLANPRDPKTWRPDIVAARREDLVDMARNQRTPALAYKIGHMTMIGMRQLPPSEEWLNQVSNVDQLDPSALWLRPVDDLGQPNEDGKWLAVAVRTGRGVNKVVLGSVGDVQIQTVPTIYIPTPVVPQGIVTL